MAGNVKEWCFNDGDDGKRYILGGACGEPIYLQLFLERGHPIQRGELLGFRCVKFLSDQRGPAAAWGPAKSIPWPAPPKREDLIDAATFGLAVKDRFTYDHSAPLDVSSEQADEGEWTHITARINAAYHNAKGEWERMTVHLYLPKHAAGPGGYQTIVYCPAMDAHILPRIRPLGEEYGLDALVRGGRAVLRPVYYGMYERRSDTGADDPKAWEDERLCFGQDLMRAIDYLQARGDINSDQLGYYGFSFGADWAGSFVAVEPRLRAAVFEAGGLSNSPLRKDRFFLSWRQYLPQIRVPVLMINGQVDPICPVKESQDPMFDLLGSTIKEHYVHPDGHHMLPPAIKFEHALRWFDRHLGKPAGLEAAR
jgi:predicted esterase